MAKSSPNIKGSTGKLNRRTFLKHSTLAAAGAAAMVGSGCSYFTGGKTRVSRSHGKKVIIIGIDGFDPKLAVGLMNQGRLPNLRKLQAGGSFSPLGTSIPPQSPVAWASFINGNNPGDHGIYDFIHRHPEHPTAPFSSFAETLPPEGHWDVAGHRLQFDFWPFNHKLSATELRRQGVPFWDYLDEKGIATTFYDLPCNYPASPSHYGHHRCISGMGAPDLMGGFGTYQYYAENGPDQTKDESGGKHYKLVFDGDTAKTQLTGPGESLKAEPSSVMVDLLVHRDRQADAAVIEIPGQSLKIVLKKGEWSKWTKVDFKLSAPWFMPSPAASGICRFYVKEVQPTFKLFVSPINIDPSAPAVKMSEPDSFLPEVSSKMGLFATAGFQEDYMARMNDVLNDDEFLRQANHVLQERLALFDYAVENYDDGLLYFYFSSSDLQSHIMWWDSADEHPFREASEAVKSFGHIKTLYETLDEVIGEVVDRYGSVATIIVMSDHGFGNFGRQFNLNTWLRVNRFLGPPDATSVLRDLKWSQTYAYGLGINGLYLNLKGREPEGIVEPGDQREFILNELVRMLEGIRDTPDHGGRQVISKVYRADEVYSGKAMHLAPDLIVGYAPGYRASWDTTLGDISTDWLSDNDSPWSADHCVDAMKMPGVFFSNQQINMRNPSLIDVAPSILGQYGLATPATMIGRNFFK